MKKTAIITGADYGHTGWAIAARFAKEGWDVAITSRRPDSLEISKKALEEAYGVTVYPFLLDLRSKEQAHAMFDALDGMGVFAETLCLNAADLALGEDPSRGTPFFDVTPEYVESILQANVVGNFRLVQLAAIRMREHHKGAIVFISSNSAVRPNANRVPYIASKGGMNSMSKALAVDLGKYGIRSNVVMPGTIKTARWISMGDKQITNGTMTPIGDISDFEDIANAAYYFGSDESKNVTGGELMVDGGMSTQIFPEILNTYRAAEIARREAEEQK
ncbi:MAG: SDR family oxidoreductase [Ruminococcaceae bacterium]|nr:SDR family oxidoreductase [Oscillospiraceae bacterium]